MLFKSRSRNIDQEFAPSKQISAYFTTYQHSSRVASSFAGRGAASAASIGAMGSTISISKEVSALPDLEWFLSHIRSGRRADVLINRLRR